MNPILESILVAAAASASGFLLCAMLGLAWHAAQPRHEADAPPSFPSFPSFPSVEQQLEIPPDREFNDPDGRAAILASPDQPVTSGQIEILCQTCGQKSDHLIVRPNGNTVCPACPQQKAILEAVFTPLE